jgi:polyisoprenoid-binding protein YceI
MIDRVIFIFLFFTCIACEDKTGVSTASNRAVMPALPTASNESRWQIDPARSKVCWRGTKAFGAGQHLGTISVKEGTVQISNGKLRAGKVVVDMKGIEISDMPLHEVVPRQNLLSHLNQDFEADQYPEAAFSITGIAANSDASYLATGNLTIRGISRQIDITIFEAEVEQNVHRFACQFEFNRFDWGIGENGSWLERNLVDATVEVRAMIITAKN